MQFIALLLKTRKICSQKLKIRTLVVVCYIINSNINDIDFYIKYYLSIIEIIFIGLIEEIGNIFLKID